jgi:hypothetical protein
MTGGGGGTAGGDGGSGGGWKPGDPDPDPGDIVGRAKRLQFYIDELRRGVRQAMGQLLDPQHIEAMNEKIAKLIHELENLFK